MTEPTEPQVVYRVERPSYTPTIVTTIFFGIIGLWPAIRHSRMARERGYTTSGYWIAFAAPAAAQVILTITLVVALGSIATNVQAGDLGAAPAAVQTQAAVVEPPQPTRPSDEQTAGANGECQPPPAKDTPPAAVFLVLWGEYRATVDHHNQQCGDWFLGGGPFLYLMTPRMEVIHHGDIDTQQAALAQVPGTTLVGQATITGPDAEGIYEADYACRQPDGESFTQYMEFKWISSNSTWQAILTGFLTFPE